MPEQVVELGLSKPTPQSPDRQGEILRWLVGRLLELEVELIGAIEHAEHDRLEEAVGRYRTRILASTNAKDLESDAHGCAALCERETDRAGETLKEKESGLREVIAVLMEAVSQLVGESSAFNASLIGQSEKMRRLAEVNDIRQLKREVTDHVDTLRRTVVEKQKADEATHAKLSRRVELLQARLTEAEQEASSDPLTGVANRRAFDRAVQRLVSTASTSGRPLAMAMIDADNMKHLNDTHGHQVGDRVLIGLVQQVQSCVRKTDFLARYGGDEFALILPDMTTAEAETRLNEVVRQIASTRYEYERDQGRGAVHFTISCGLASFAAGDTAEELVKRADEALYDAKRAGKNRVGIRNRSKLGSLFGRLTGSRDRTVA